MSLIAQTSGEVHSGAAGLPAPGGLDRKRVILLLRYVVIASAAYLVLAGERPLPDARLLYVAAFAASNLVLSAVPAAVFYLPQFGPLLLLADTAVILFGLSWTSAFSQDLLLVYFFTIFMTSVGESLASIAVAGALTSGLYGYWLLVGNQHAIRPETWLRLPFIFLITIFYAFLTEQLKMERRRRVVAEDESAHLRLLLDLAGVFSETHATREFVKGIGRFVEHACPGIRCTMVLRDRSAGHAGSGFSFDLRAHGKSYGELLVQKYRRRRLSERESWLCQMVAHAAAGALYAAEQSDAARTAAETKEQFLGTISHELRTPLHAVLGYAEILDLTLPREDRRVRDSVERLHINACRLQDLIEELLSFAEIRAGNRVVIPERFSLSALVEELAPVTRELVGSRPVRFLWCVRSEANSMVTDRRMLRQAVLCLLSNAAKFTQSGRIVVSAELVGNDSVELLISDTGIGISAEHSAAIFDLFKQVDSSLTRRYDGLGLGLPIARELITLLGGAMEIDSKAGVGTTVRVRVAREHAGQRQQPGPHTTGDEERSDLRLAELSRAG
jgi:signal transduction histidine kinase